ncbi:MAG: hypothetical protein ACK2UY_11605, partial [Anaerolineae bacterium]
EDKGGQIAALPHQIAELAARGYRHGQALEARAETLQKSWPAARRQALAVLEERAGSLAELGKPIERLCARPSLADNIIDQLEHKLDQLEAQTDTAERDVRGTFDTLGQQLYQLQREFKTVEFLLDSLDTASFDLYPDEYGVAACEAAWTNHPDEPKGILFLTEGRLIFEQREKKATKKMLFITTESEMVQDKLWDTPIGNVAELEAEDRKKFLRRKEMLELRFREYTGGLHGEVTLQLDGASNEEWAGLVKRVQRGEFDTAPAGAAGGEGEPLAPLDPRDVPTRCPACGGQLPPLVKGMRELVCQYCGTVTRL